MEINNINFKAGDRIVWLLGPKKLRRTGIVRYVGNGYLEVETTHKTTPIRRVEQSAQPHRLDSD